MSYPVWFPYNIGCVHCTRTQRKDSQITKHVSSSTSGIVIVSKEEEQKLVASEVKRDGGKSFNVVEMGMQIKANATPIIVLRVLVGSVAQINGIEEGDIIMGINGKAILSYQDYFNIMASSSIIPNVFTMVISRGGIMLNKIIALM